MMKISEDAKTWTSTRVQHLVRHKSGRYYARLFLHSGEIWKSLKTSDFSIGQARLSDELKEHRKRKGRALDPGNPKMTFAEAAAIAQQRLEREMKTKRRTRKYYAEILAAVLKSWPELPETPLRRLTPAAFDEWAGRYVRMFSTTRYNGTLSLLRHILEPAAEQGIIGSDPAGHLKRRKVKARHLELPTLAQFADFIEAMRTSKNRHGKNCAELAQGLAFTGCRISEAARLEWRSLSFVEGEVLVKGDPEEGTKNGEIRRVPMIPQARVVFLRMREERANEAATEPIFRVRECQHSMERAAEKVGMSRITHQDLRHFFATVSIESGVDIPTVSRWLGHKDGGALAMRTYGHLRREHSRAQAQKVCFTARSAA